MNAIELLKKDHKTVKSLFESFEKAKEQEQERSKSELFASIKEELDAHARVEEEIFYPAFERAAEEDDDKELVLEAGEEHKQVKTLLAELEGLDPDDETFEAKMKVLKDNIEHHVEEEEGEMFPHARKQLGDDELEQLGGRIAALKERIQQESAGQPSSRREPAAPAPSRARRARTTSPGRRSASTGRTSSSRPSGTRSRASSGGRSSSARSSSSRAGSSSSRAAHSPKRRTTSSSRTSSSRSSSASRRGRTSSKRGRGSRSSR